MGKEEKVCQKVTKVSSDGIELLLERQVENNPLIISERDTSNNEDENGAAVSVDVDMDGTIVKEEPIDHGVLDAIERGEENEDVQQLIIDTNDENKNNNNNNDADNDNGNDDNDTHDNFVKEQPIAKVKDTSNVNVGEDKTNSEVDPSNVHVINMDVKVVEGDGKEDGEKEEKEVEEKEDENTGAIVQSVVDTTAEQNDQSQDNKEEIKCNTNYIEKESNEKKYIICNDPKLQTLTKATTEEEKVVSDKNTIEEEIK